jgi:hypothetical protein
MVTRKTFGIEIALMSYTSKTDQKFYFVGDTHTKDSKWAINVNKFMLAR